MDDLKRFHHEGTPLGRGVASSAITATGEPHLDMARHRRLVRELMQHSMESYECADRLLETHNPSRLIVFNGRFAGSQASARRALAAGVAVSFAEVSANRTGWVLQREGTHDFEAKEKRIEARWNAASSGANTAHRFFLERRQGHATGGLAFTQDQNIGALPRRRKDSRWVYFSTSDDELASTDSPQRPRLFEHQRDAIAWLVNRVAREPETELVIRVHPHMTRKGPMDRAWWEGIEGPNVTVISASSEVDSYALAQDADLAFVYASTMGIEAAYMGTPTVLLGDSAYRNSGAVMCPETIDALEEAVVNPMQPSQASCLPYAYYAMTEGEQFAHVHPMSHGLWGAGDDVWSYHHPWLDPLIHGKRRFVNAKR